MWYSIITETYWTCQMLPILDVLYFNLRVSSSSHTKCSNLWGEITINMSSAEFQTNEIITILRLLICAFLSPCLTYHTCPNFLIRVNSFKKGFSNLSNHWYDTHINHIYIFGFQPLSYSFHIIQFYIIIWNNHWHWIQRLFKLLKWFYCAYWFFHFEVPLPLLFF